MEQNCKKNSLDFLSAGYLPLFAYVAEVVFQIAVLAIGLSKGVETWVCVVGNQLMFLSVCVAMFWRRNVSFVAATGIKKSFDGVTALLLVPVALLCLAAFAPLAGAFSLLMEACGYTYVPDYQVAFDSFGATLLAAFALGVLPIIGEEVLFRSALLGGLKHKGYVFAILCSALFFAVIHGNMNQLVHQFLLGVVLGYAMVITGSVWAPAIIHFCNNFFAVIIEYMYLHNAIGGGVYGYFCGSSWQCGVAGVMITLAVCIASFCVLAALVVLAGYRCKKYNAKHKEADFASDDIGKMQLAEGRAASKAESTLSAVCGTPADIKPISKLDYLGGAVSLAVLVVALLIGFISEV